MWTVDARTGCKIIDEQSGVCLLGLLPIVERAGHKLLIVLYRQTDGQADSSDGKQTAKHSAGDS